MPIKAMEEEAEATREFGMIKHTTIINGRTSNAKSVDKRYTQLPIAKIEDKDNDDKSMKTTSSRARLKKLAENVKNMSRSFTIVNTQLQILKEADSYISDSEDEYEASNFQMANIKFGKSDFGFPSWMRNANPAFQVFSTRLPVITLELKPSST